MSLDTVMNLSISVESRAPSQEGFGTPLLFGYHTNNLGDLVKEYAQPDEMLDDGFDADHFLYKAAQIVKSQDPSPSTFKIGRRVTPLTQVVLLTPHKTAEGFKYKGTVGGKAFTYVVLAGATEETVAAGIAAAINALSAGTTAATDTEASVTSSVAGPWSLANGDTLLVAIDADVPGSPDTATFSATAAARETTNSSSTPFNLANNDTLTVKIDGGAVQTITFVTANFVDIDAATPTEIAAVINAQLIGGRATVTSGGTKVTITSDRKGTGSHVEVTGGTANAGAALNFATAVVNGTGNVSNIAAVTFAEVKSIVEAATDATVIEAPGGYAKFSSSTTGTSSKVAVTAASTADDEMGFDNATHTGTEGGGVVTCTADDAGTVVGFDFTDVRAADLELKDATTDTTTDNELPNVKAEDDGWYGLLVCDSFSKATALNVAGYIETTRKEALVQTADTDCLDSDVDDDTMSALKDSSYARTGAVFHRAIGVAEWLAAGWLGGALTTTPGEASMAYKEVPGVKKDKLQPAEENAILAKNGSYYTDLAGTGSTFEGKSGAGEFMDTTRFIDWVYARMRETVAGALQNNPKIPYTDGGVDIMRGLIMSVIQLGIKAGGFAASPAPTISAPLVKDVAPADRINRILPDINWTAQLAGAIHRLNPVKGRVSV